MKEYRYNYKHRSFSVPLFDEEGIVLSDCLFIYNNPDIGSLLIYDRLRFGRKCVIGFPICYSFTDTKCEEAVRCRMVELLQKNPHFSMSELVKITGHSRSTITRHYMFLKRNLGSLTNVWNIEIYGEHILPAPSEHRYEESCTSDIKKEKWQPAVHMSNEIGSIITIW